jgi:hypothetical protein
MIHFKEKEHLYVKNHVCELHVKPIVVNLFGVVDYVLGWYLMR